MNGLIQQLNNIALPQDLIIKVVFYLVAGLVAYFALRVVISRNIFHSSIFLALALIGVACIYLFLDAEFLAVVQILIYVGAIATLFIFVIMLTADIQDRAIKQANQQVLISAVVALAFFYIFVNIIIRNPWHMPNLHKTQTAGLEQLGRLLMTEYLLPFEVISLVLLVALVGAIVIGKVRK